MDECDTAAKVYECASVKMPDILSDVVNRGGLSTMVKYRSIYVN
jgi:hypothetical protein